MAMDLTPDDLRAIADQVEAAGRASFEVETIKVGSIKVMLKCTTKPPVQAGSSVIPYRIVGITKGEWSGGGGNCR